LVGSIVHKVKGILNKEQGMRNKEQGMRNKERITPKNVSIETIHLHFKTQNDLNLKRLKP